ncbi:DEAD/DEAH box helicase family protein, partial [Microbacterium gubbeenense]|uniref:DEAD/DEAH box helicase family protein n=1 Tax=Microbacterium gubbeenense TaxID=159896 RepID=UPI00056627A8
PPSTTGSATDYLWRQVLARPMFLRILKDFALYEPSTSGKKNDGRLIFPRFHQLRAVERVVADIENQGPGGRYLVWHSAGSGKTKTIAWLSHRLIRHMGSDATSTFDSVIVVTDRTVLDENVREDMNLVQSSTGLVVNIGTDSGAKSAQVKDALLDGGHIITCTLQTFPHVMKLIEDTDALRGRHWAIVADEAHSSQTGSSARALKGLLADVELDDEEISADDLLAATDSAIAASANITFIALTATPKGKTLRLFGTKVDGEDRWEAFDNYTMAQAIEEGFILDVLTNYSTYDMFLRVKNELEEEDETEVETGRAVKDIVRFTRLHPTAIAQKVQVVVEHFRRNVAHMLDGQARAMVVTSGRKDAVMWSEKMNAYIADRGYQGLETLVAFSGTVRNEAGQEVTEVGMNERSDVARAFREEDEARVLIVANKFQTGFDEPRLMAMYVDKVLTDIATVQTLSRLNRIYPGKSAPMVVDFMNTPEQIQKDFARYYTDAHVAGEVDANALIELADRLDAAGLYTDAQLRAVAEAYTENQGGEAIQRALGPIKHAWMSQLRQAGLTKDKERYEELKQFRSDAISYRNAWQFLSQIVDYQDEELRLRAVLMTLLSRNLHLSPEAYDDSYMEGVQLGGIKLVPEKVGENYAVDPSAERPTIDLPDFASEPRGETAKPKGPLDEAIEKVNEMFSAKGVDASPTSIEGFITAYWGYLDADDEAVAMAKSNTVEQLKGSTKFSDAVDYAMYQAFQASDEIKKALADADVLRQLAAISAETLHAQHHNSGDDDA